MKIIEIQALENGAHKNQAGANIIPNGWAVIPDNMETPNFPFGEITVEEIDGVMTVISWKAGEIPETTSEQEPSVNEVECDGIILTSPNGTRYKITIDDLGCLVYTKL